MKTIIRVQDQYNENKVYLVKIYSCGHTYINQEIGGHVIYSKYVKTTKANLKEFIGLDIYKNTKKPNEVIDSTRLENGDIEIVMNQNKNNNKIGNMVTVR